MSSPVHQSVNQIKDPGEQNLPSFSITKISLAQRVWEMVKSLFAFLMSPDNNGWSILYADCLAKKAVLPVANSQKSAIGPLPTQTALPVSSKEDQTSHFLIVDLEYVRQVEAAREAASLREQLEANRDAARKEKESLEKEVEKSLGFRLKYEEEEQQLKQKKIALSQQLEELSNKLSQLTSQKENVHSVLAPLLEIQQRAYTELDIHHLSKTVCIARISWLEEECKKNPKNNKPPKETSNPQGISGFFSQVRNVASAISTAGFVFLSDQDRYKRMEEQLARSKASMQEKAEAEPALQASYKTASTKYKEEEARVQERSKALEQEIDSTTLQIHQKQMESVEIEKAQQTLQERLEDALAREKENLKELNAAKER